MVPKLIKQRAHVSAQPTASLSVGVVSFRSVPFRAAAACLPGHSTSDLSPFLLGGGEEEEHAHGPLILSYDDPTD
jgi:hypothetical protein